MRLLGITMIGLLIIGFIVIHPVEGAAYNLTKIKPFVKPNQTNKDVKKPVVKEHTKPVIKPMEKVIYPNSKKKVNQSLVYNFTKSDFIAVELSNVCLRMLLSDTPSTCPTYKDLVKFDNTKQEYSGKFINDTYFHRDKPKISNHEVAYQTATRPVVCVDCSREIIHAARVIYIDQRILPYTLDEDNMTNNTRAEYHARYVDNCRTAHIIWSTWLLADTIKYLDSNCTITAFNEKEMIIKDYTHFDITTSQAYKYQQWLKEAKKLKDTNCIKSDVC